MATSARLDELKKKFDENPRRYFAPLANEYRKLGDLTQAVALCRAHLPNQPGHISGHIVLAQALYEARELGESRQIFEASLDLDPENLIALRYLGDIAREQGEPGAARGWYERVLEADPRNDEIAQLLAQLDAAPAAPASVAAAFDADGPGNGPQETLAPVSTDDET
jgi:cytochrome c-type biogenesis protein CcmH/NrfG